MGGRGAKTVVVPLLFVLVLVKASVRVSDFGVSTKLHIVNGSESIVKEGESNFVFCFASLRNLDGRPYSVVWTDPKGRRLLPFSGVSLETRLFSVHENDLRPNAYMVFQRFDEDLEGVYTCNLVFKRRLVSLRRIRLKMFRPTYKLMALPQCLTVQEGESALVPSPVVGVPPSPPIWTKAGAALDPHKAQVVQAGLVLQNIRGPAVYRVLVSLGGGLQHQQEVVIGVLRADGRREFPQNTPAGAVDNCPHWGTVIHAGLASGVALANEVIADIQMHS